MDFLNREFHPRDCKVTGCRRCVDRLVKARDANINAWAITSSRITGRYPDAGSKLAEKLKEQEGLECKTLQ